MTHKTQVNIRIPDIENLYCINCKVNPVDMRQDPLVKSLFHSQILTCRLIIYTMRCCIASPSIQNADDLIHVIINKSFYESGKLQDHLSKLKVNYTNPEPVHPKIYQACLKYTFSFRLSPHWNSIGKSYYLQGFNFLSLTSNINAIEWNILFKNSNDAQLQLIPMKMNLFPLTFDSLSLPPKTVDGFMVNRYISSIDLTSLESPWVYVLPKLTRARIVSVSKILPASCPFQNYNDLRRHWKNMYSYRLPKSGQGLLFYEVVFSTQPNQYFTYPETCILSKMPELLMCDNKNEVASQFLKDLSTNVHSVCGDAIQICHLYPELSIEYSCVLTKKNVCENQYSQSQQSPFFKTPAELMMKPVNEKLNLSSLFTFQGMDKMKPDMLHHRQKVLSIMQNNKRKKKCLEDDNEHLTQSKLNNKKKKLELSQKYLSMIPEIKQEKTIVNNLDDILSYHDIPSMCPKRETKKSDKDLQEKEKSAEPVQRSSRPQPVIKSVQDIPFYLRDGQLLTNSSEHEMIEKEANKQNNILNEANYNTTQSIPKLPNSMQKGNLQHVGFDQCTKETPKSLPVDQNYMYRKLQSSIRSVDLNDKILTELLPKETCDKSLDSVETQSYDQKIRSFLSSFDLYNIHDHDESGMEKELYEQYKNSPTTSEFNDRVSTKTFTKSISKTSFEESELVENDQKNLNYNVSLDKQSHEPSKSSISLSNLKKDDSTDLCQKNLESTEDGLFENNCIFKNEHEFCRQSVFKTIPADSKRVSQHKSNEQKFFETPHTSANGSFGKLINGKQLQNNESPTDEGNSKIKVENEKNSEFAPNSVTRNNEKSCRDVYDSSFTSDNLQSSCKTPSLNSVFDSMGNTEALNKYINTPQYSTDIQPSHIEAQNRNTTQYKKDIHEFADQSDFTSILSESSSGSDTNDYESCKLVFNEALTLKK